MCSHSVEKVTEATAMFVMADYVSEMTVKMFCRANMDRLIICSSCPYFQTQASAN